MGFLLEVLAYLPPQHRNTVQALHFVPHTGIYMHYDFTSFQGLWKARGFEGSDHSPGAK